MSGRPKIFDNEAVIEKAADLFWSQGYEITSTEDLLRAMGIGKGSFYLAFKGGKKELYEKVLEKVSQKELNTLKDNIAKSQAPVEEIKKLFRSIAKAPKATNLKGCIFGNTLAEFSNNDAQIMQIAARHLKELETVFQLTIEQAQAAGQMQSKDDSHLLARYLITTWNGLGISRRLYPDPKALSGLIEMQLGILD